jgi:dynactin-4
VGTPEEEPLRQGRSYLYELAFTNPLYEPIEVSLSAAAPTADASAANKSMTAPWAVNLQAPSFPISAFAEAWEYEDDEAEEEGDDGGRSGGKKRLAPGIVERKANRTTVALELHIGRETVGPVKVSASANGLNVYNIY